MAFKMQSILRQYRHVKGRGGEILIMIAYLIYTGYLGYWFIFKPTLRLIVNTMNYQCDDGVKLFLVILGSWMHIAEQGPA